MPKTAFSPLEMRQGIVIDDGGQHLLISTDYPYYRDKASHWADRLEKLKSLGIQVITAYIPWRHHQTDPGAAPDFNGHTQPNRNVHAFLQQCAELDLAVIAKPGPFIHAELNYGGLPDWVCPQNNPAIEALRDGEGEAVRWWGARLDQSGKAIESWPLPAPFDPEFQRLTAEWMQRVGEQVIRPHQAPGGPIIALQIANEGIYSNGQHAPWAYDYSQSGLQQYREFLANKYQSMERYNAQHKSAYDCWEAIPAPRPRQAPHSSTQLVDWGEFSAEYMEQIFRAWASPLSSSLPVLVNQNPPLGTHYGADAWLSRVEPERWGRVIYGFTNWVGDVSANPGAYQRYVLTAKRWPGPNLEENWGFAELYDPAYVDAATSLYQTLLMLNNGATGFNVYTGAETGYADTNLEVLPKAPYPDASPIKLNGELTPKAQIVRWLAQYFDQWGAEFLACRSIQPAAWGVYLPQARRAAWSAEGDPNAPQHGLHLSEFQRQLRALHLDYGLVNLQTIHLEELLSFPNLFIAGGKQMEAAVQRLLKSYVRQGGQLSVIGELPRWDEAGSACTLLCREETRVHTATQVDAAARLADTACPQLLAGEADLWVRSHPTRDVHYVTLLIPAQGKPTVRLIVQVGSRKHAIELQAAPSSGALLRVENGQLSDLLLKGHNGFLGISVPPRINFDGVTIGMEIPGDLICLGAQQENLPAATIKGAE